ncbi:MAG: hypothetical protein AAF849_21020 [Bacteroidota bacterium]
MDCLTSIYEIRLDDSLLQDVAFYYLAHPNRNELGIYTVLDIEQLDRGPHTIDVKYKLWKAYADTLVIEDWVNIPFWKENPAPN